MKIEPYLFFNGHCDAAIDFYKRVFGAEQVLLMRYRDSPEAPPMALPPGWEDKVMHASVQIGETMLMASDGCVDGTAEFKGVSLSVTMPDADTAAKVFTALADGGEVTMPLRNTFFAPRFGMVTDRFGIGWMISVREQPDIF